MSAENKTERTEYKIQIEADPFNPVGEYKLVSSTELGAMAYAIFKEAFADFEGVIFEDPRYQQQNGGELVYSLLFNHGKYTEEDKPIAVQRSIDSDKTNMNSVVDRIRFTDSLYRNGDKYLITEDGKDVIKPLLTRLAFNNGKPKWNQIVTEYAERQNNYYWNTAATQYTKITGISATRLASLIFGRNDKETGDVYDYGVIALGPASPASINGVVSDYMLQITRASTNETKAVYKKLGYSTAQTNIIRG